MLPESQAVRRPAARAHFLRVRLVRWAQPPGLQARLDQLHWHLVLLLVDAELTGPAADFQQERRSAKFVLMLLVRRDAERSDRCWAAQPV